MINLLLGLAALLGLSFLGHLLGIHIVFSVLMGIAAGVAVFIWQGRKVQQQLEAIFTRAGERMSGEAIRSEAMKNKKLDEAVEVMKEGYRFSRRQFMVKGSIDGQIGAVRYLQGRNEEAEPLLAAAAVQDYNAKAMLGILQWKRGEKKKARETFDFALKTAKKESLLYAVYAYVLNEMGDREKAIDVLNKGLAVLKDDERLLTNRNLLQNAKPMKMKAYGDQWYRFMLERPKLVQEPPPYVGRMSRRSLRG